MLTAYEAPSVIAYGSVAAITSSAKCSPGGDSVFATHAEEASGTFTVYSDGTKMLYGGSDPVAPGTTCYNQDGSTFIAG